MSIHGVVPVKVMSKLHIVIVIFKTNCNEFDIAAYTIEIYDLNYAHVEGNSTHRKIITNKDTNKLHRPRQ